MEIAIASPAAKYFSAEPLVNANATTMTIDANTPENTLTRTGVPNRGEIRPNHAGPAPSAHATA